MRLDPIRLAIPQVSKDTCRELWGSCLQFNQIEKPENLKLRGSAWFRKEAVEIHLGTETPISAAKKAHLGNAVEDIDALSGHVEQQSCSVTGIHPSQIGTAFSQQIPLATGSNI